MPKKHEIAPLVFREEEVAIKSRETMIMSGWDCTEVHQLSNGGWAFEAKREKK